jgi:PAS domain S-box-containing protein
MGWLAFGIFYSVAYAVGGSFLADQPSVLSWYRACALFVPPLTGVAVIVMRRKRWAGCQWLFWSTIGLGLVMSAIGLTGWAADELFSKQETWLAWPAVFALFGGVAPLFALLAQPHRGVREPLAATTAVDIAGLAVVTGFLYSFFVTAPASDESNPLLIVSEMQQALVVAGMIAATFVARGTVWRDTYRRLAMGSLVSFAMLTLSNFEAGRGLYRTGYVYDFTWILPFAFYPWAASLAPTADDDEPLSDEDGELTRPRPWVIFAAVAMIPFIDFGLRRITVDTSGFRDLSTAVTFISVLPLLVARIAAERAELQQADGTMRLLTQVIEQAQDLILVLTPDGHVRHANQAFCRAMGVPREDLMTMRSGDLMAREIVSAEDIQELVNGGGTWRGTVTRSRRDGSTFPVSASVAAIVDDRGRPTHVVSVERDISEERRLREQLIHSERLSAVGELVAGVAHELNNPLQSVMGFTELLLRNERREEVRRDLERVQLDADRAAKIVRNLLAFVRRSALERSLVDLSELVRSTVALKAFDFQAAHIELQEDYENELPLVVASREEIRQVILNLISNAEHAVRGVEHAGVIRLKTRSEGGFSFVEVSDNGPGIPPDMTGRVFEPFFTTKVVGQGTGLGLSISLGIAEAHGGALTLVHADGPGASFVLKLPIASEPQRPIATEHAERPIVPVLPVRAGGLVN